MEHGAACRSLAMLSASLPRLRRLDLRYLFPFGGMCWRGGGRGIIFVRMCCVQRYPHKDDATPPPALECACVPSWPNCAIASMHSNNMRLFPMHTSLSHLLRASTLTLLTAPCPSCSANGLDAHAIAPLWRLSSLKQLLLQVLRELGGGILWDVEGMGESQRDIRVKGCLASST